MLHEWKQQAELNALTGVETIAVREFSQILESLSRIESQLAPFESSPSTGSNQSMLISQSRSDVLRYVILGIDDESWVSWFQLFADELPDDANVGAVEEVCFDDLDEMQSVFATLNSVVAKANEVKKNGGDAQQAFERALFEEGIARISRFVFASSDTNAPKPSGLKYVIWGIRADHVNTIRILRPQGILGQQKPVIRDATELYFEKPAIVPHIPRTVGKAAELANGDAEEFKRQLFEAALRIRLLGPDSE